MKEEEKIQRKYKWSKRINFVKSTPALALQVNPWKNTILDAAVSAKNQGFLWNVETHKVHSIARNPTGGCAETPNPPSHPKRPWHILYFKPLTHVL